MRSEDVMEKVGLPKRDTEICFKLIMKRHQDICVDIYWSYVGASSCNLAGWAKDVEYVA